MFGGFGRKETYAKPTSTTIEEMIEEEEALVNGKLSQVYVTPITGTVSKKILRGLLKQICKHRIQSIMNTKTGKQLDQQKPENLYFKVQKELSNIIKNKLLPDATELPSNSYGITDYNHANDIEPDYDVTKEQW